MDVRWIPVPAHCNDCGKTFPTAFRIQEGASNGFKNLSFGPCTFCGGTGTILDGIYHSVYNGVLKMTPYDQTNGLIELVWTFEKLADEKTTDANKISEAIKKVAPAYQWLGEAIKKDPILAGGLKYLGRLLLATVLAMSKCNDDGVKPELTEKQIQQVIAELEARSSNKATTHSEQLLDKLEHTK